MTAERFERHLHELGDAELLGVLLAGGLGCGTSMRLAHEVLRKWGGLAGLPGASWSMLRHCGLADPQAAALLAMWEIACRLARQRLPDRLPLSRPEEVARYLTLRYRRRDQEVVGALFLDLRHRLLGDQEIFRGTMHRTSVEPREILKECLLRGAGGFVLFKTHPSGDPAPSAEELLFTRRMGDAAAVLGIELVDHMFLGETGNWMSMRAAGWIVNAADTVGGSASVLSRLLAGCSTRSTLVRKHRGHRQAGPAIGTQNEAEPWKAGPGPRGKSRQRLEREP